VLAGGGVLEQEGNAIPGEPSALDSLAGQLRDAAGTVASIQSRISAEGLAGDWKGSAAAAFRSSLQELPGELGQLQNSFGTAADVLSSYASTLAGFQDTANWLAGQIIQAEEDLQGAQQRHAAAQSSLDHAFKSYMNASDPVSKASSQRELDRAGTTAAQAGASVNEFNGQLEGLKAQATANRIDFQAAASACCAGLNTAGNLGIHNSLGSWWDRNVIHGIPGKVVHGVGAAVLWTGKEIEDAGKAVEHWAETTAKDFNAFLKDPSWDTARKLLEDVKAPLTVAGVVLLVAGVVFTGGTLGVVIAAAADTVVVLNTADDLAVAGGDASEAEWGSGTEQEEARGHLLGDAEGLATDAVDLKVIHGTNLDEGDYESALERYANDGNQSDLDDASDLYDKLNPARPQIVYQDLKIAGAHYGIEVIGHTAQADLHIGKAPDDQPKANFHIISLPISMPAPMEAIT
jgi:uncharacterized protein YukE